jgi:hypothetical protein
MANVAWGKKILAVAVLSCLCASIAVPAYAFYYVHGEENVAATSKGVIEVTCTVDETAQGGGVKTSLIIVPEGSTAAACLDESVVSSNSQNGLAAIHDYSVSSLADELSGSTRARCTRPTARSRARTPRSTEAAPRARARRSSASTAWCSRWRKPPRGGSDDQPAPRAPPVPARRAPRYSSQAGPMQHRDASACPRKQTGALPNIILRGLFFYYPRSNVCASSAKP